MTVNYNTSTTELPWTSSWRIPESSSLRLLSWTELLMFKVKVTLWLTVNQSGGPGFQIFITVWQLRSCFCGAPSLTRGRVCLLYMLLDLASAVFLGSESPGTRDHILLSQIWDFPFRRLLRLAGSRWRYWTSPPHWQLPVRHYPPTFLW
jgi:hypothetical protein